MKSIKTFALAIIAIFTISTVSATAIEQDRFFDETYMGVTIGTDGMGKSGDWIGMNAGLRIGKWFTPQVGFELEGVAQFNDFYKRINSHRVGLNALLNLNYLNGYKGYRQDCEFVPFVGLGWQRNYNPCVNCQSLFGNYLYTKMGLQININMGKGWQFNIIPQVAYNLSGPGKLQYNVNYLDYGIALGVTYNFKNSHGTHFFKTTDAVYTQAQMDVINERVNKLKLNNEILIRTNESLTKALDDCMNKPELIQTVKEKVVDRVVVFPTIGFEKGKANISNASLMNITQIANYINETDSNYVVVGYASEEGPELLNRELSCERATNVMQALINAGVDPSRIEAIGEGPTTQFGDLEYNRVVIINLKK